MRDQEQTTQIFNQYRSLLLAIAYRMLGSMTDAEDIVQEAFIRWLQHGEEAKSPKALLSTIVVRLCIDQQRLARVQREVYVGPWLPEPVIMDQCYDISDAAAMTESLSFAFLLMLERLGPLERAVFLLREVFDYTYSEIADIVGKSETNCRQILHRAHQHLGKKHSRFQISSEEQRRMTDLFLQAYINGDMQGLLNLLADDVVFAVDSGGKVKTAGRIPVHGHDKVARGMLGGLRFLPANIQARVVEVNGQWAIVGYQEDGHPYGMILFDIVENNNRTLVKQVFLILNPDKLRNIGRLPE